MGGAFERMSVTERYMSSGDEGGTAPGDRKFRPDIQGLRAIAILLVVLFHVGFPGFTGGYVGVDVFFVISGFVITGVLLRERASRSATSLLHFYGRRIRRILPAATLVIVTTVIGAAILLTSVAATSTAVDGQWTSLFLANFHFAANSTNYPGFPTSALSVAELLVVRGRGAVLHRVSHDLSDRCRDLHPVLASAAPRDRSRRCHRRLIRPFHHHDRHRSIWRVLFPIHPCLGVGTGRTGSGGKSAAEPSA